MSRIKSDKINLGNSIVVDFFSDETPEPQEFENNEEILPEQHSRINLMEQEAKDKIEKMLDDAKNEAQKIIEEAEFTSQQLKDEAQVCLDEAKNEAQEILNKANQEAQSINEAANQEAQTIRETASKDGAKEGFEAGYSDGREKIHQELMHKIKGMDEIALSAFDVKNKILNSSKHEIVELVLLIAKKICIDSIDKEAVAKVVSSSIKLLSDKENIELILSEKYARLLNEILNGEDAENIDIDKLRGIKLTYNSKFSDDTLIVQTPKERLDLGFKTQLDNISKEFLNRLNTVEEQTDEEEPLE